MVARASRMSRRNNPKNLLLSSIRNALMEARAFARPREIPVCHAKHLNLVFLKTGGSRIMFLNSYKLLKLQFFILKFSIYYEKIPRAKPLNHNAARKVYFIY
jgi:hypothetical protein